IATLVAAIHEAAKLRLASDMRWLVLRAATGLPPIDDIPAAWQATLAAARKIDLEIPRTALRWKAMHYATPTPRLDQLREERLLTVPELGAAEKLDGTRTVKSLVTGGPLDPQQTARFLWTMGSIGALVFSAEVHDLATTPRRMLHDMRTHLRARSQRLERSTFYDVLELTPLAEYPDIEEAYRLVAARYAPNVLAEYDLSELQPQIKPMWELVEKARSVLVDHSARGRYHDWLRQKLPELRTVWAIDPANVHAAAHAFTKGQAALGEGDVHKAMSELAVACRKFPGHPEYEANFAWARYRVQVASGRDRVECAVTERAVIEELLLGCRPWPRALVPLALLCAAGSDAESARWHLHTALTVDPTVAAAAQLAQKLGMRR
ncbi:MAG: J domain-containing protein, partial [Kofleriaceae bacterium]